MKNFLKLLGLSTIAVLIGFAMIACDNGGGWGVSESGPQRVTYTGTINGAAYTLEITQSVAKYAAQTGDTYKLSSGGNVSTGTVYAVTSGKLTLKPSKDAAETFEITIAGNTFTAAEGATITFDDGTEIKVGTSGPGEIGLSSPVLFSNGAWIDDVGEVTITGFTKSGNNLKGGNDENTSKGDFLFEKPIDVTGYTKLVFTTDADFWWAGGQIYTVYEEGYEGDNGETVYIAKYGQWSDVNGSNGIATLTFSDLGQETPDKDDGVVPFNNKVIGFNVNLMQYEGNVSISKIELVK